MTFPCPDCGMTWEPDHDDPVAVELMRAFGEGPAVSLSRCASCGRGIGVYCTVECTRCAKGFAWLKTSPRGRYRELCDPCIVERERERHRLHMKKRRAAARPKVTRKR